MRRLYVLARGASLPNVRTLALAFRFVMCELGGMDKPTSLSAAAGISISYASELLSGKRTPSPVLAISIYRKTGRKFGVIANASASEITAMERVYARNANA